MVSGASKETLEEVRNKHEIIPQLLEWKRLEKFITAFGKTLLQHVGPDGRIHATFEQLGADSGRITCREPNLQQMPKPQDDNTNIRSCFVAPPGHKLLVADLSNIELRILAEVSGDPTMLRFFAEGKDLHSETAKLMFKLPPETDPKKYLINGVKARDIAKTINFGLAYGMGPSGLANRVGVDLETAKRLMQTYFATYKGVDGYLKRTGQKGVKEGYAVSLSGRRRFFAQEDRTSPAKRGRVERAAKNHPIQGTNADILKYALALLHDQLPEDVQIVLTVHDEIILEAPTPKVEASEKVLKYSMVTACRKFLEKVSIPEPDVLVAEYWVKG
jgi:DNA polymerase-1